MPTTVFPNCPCCGPASGSGRSGSGTGPRRITTACGQVLPAVIYATFDGVLSFLNANPVVLVPTIAGSTWDSPAYPNDCQAPPPVSPWGFGLSACQGLPGGGFGLYFSGGTFPGEGAYNSPLEAYCAVLSWVPFLATVTASVAPGPGSACSSAAVTAVLTETPP